MSNPIRIKKGLASGLPIGASGEPLWTTDTNQFYIGTGTSNILISSTVTPSALTKTDDTNVTLTLGGSPNTALLAGTSLTLGWTGTLADNRITSSGNWNTAYNDRLKWDGGATDLVAATGRASLGLVIGTDVQAQLNGTGFVKASGTSITYDNSTYLTTISGIAASGELSGTYPSPTLVTSAVTGKLLTGLNLTGGGSIAATDSILQAFGKVQNQISGLAGGVTYQGTWNASTNTPTLTSSVGTKGYYYIVDVAGSTNLNGITDWKVGDWAIFNGSTWDKVDNTDAVSSVNGFTGAVSLTTANIPEVTNLYYLDSRARAAISLTTTGTSGAATYDNTTGVFNIPQYQGVLTNPITGTGTSGQVAYFNGTTSLTSNATFAFTPTSQLLVNNSVTAASAIARGTNITPTLTAAANGDVLVGLDINPTFTNGAFTGVSNYIIRAGQLMTLDNNGNLFLGTVNTSLGIAKGLTINGGATNNEIQLRLQSNNTGTTSTDGLLLSINGFRDAFLWNYENNPLIFGTNSTERVRIFANGNVGINTSTTDAGFRLDVNGTARVQDNLLVSKNQSANTLIEISNTTSATSSIAGLKLTSSNGFGQLAKTSQLFTDYKNIIKQDTYLYNGTGGNLSFLNDFATGNINFAAGGASTAQATLFSTGNLALNTTTDAGFRLDVNGTARVQGALTISNTSVGVITGGNDTNSRPMQFQNDATTGLWGGGYTFRSGYNGSAGVTMMRLFSNGTTSNANAVGIGNYSEGALQNNNIKLAVFDRSTGSGATLPNYSDGISINSAAGSNYNYSNTKILGLTIGEPDTGGQTAQATTATNYSVNLGFQRHPLTNGWGSSMIMSAKDDGGSMNEVMRVMGRNQSVGIGVTQTTSRAIKFQLGGSVTATSALAQGAFFNNTLVAAANNDVLVGLDINPTFTNGAFTGVQNVALRVQGISIGLGSGAVSTNTRVGNTALNSNTTGSENTAIGFLALASNTTGINNTAVGYNALGTITTASNNTAFGRDALGFTTTNNNTAFGRSCLSSQTSGSENTGLGYLAMTHNTTGSQNVVLGFQAGRFIADGSTSATVIGNSILIGYNTKVLANSQNNQIVIGHNETGLGNNTTIIGNSSTLTTAIRGNLLLGTTTDAGFRLDVNGTTRLNGQITGPNGLIITNSTIQAYNQSLQVTQGTGGTLTEVFASVAGGATSIRQSIFTTGGGSNFQNQMQFRVFNGFNPTGLLILRGDGLAVFEYSSTPTYDTSAIVAVNSTTKGFLPPRGTNAQRNAIASPAIGLVFYCTDATEGLYIYTASGWRSLAMV